jgi:PKD repeat protein
MKRIFMVVLIGMMVFGIMLITFGLLLVNGVIIKDSSEPDDTDTSRSNIQPPINTPPQASDISLDLTRTKGLHVYFSTAPGKDTDGDNLTYSWDAGDKTGDLIGKTSFDHVYSKPGNYTIILTVSDSKAVDHSYLDIILNATVCEVPSYNSTGMFEGDAADDDMANGPPISKDTASNDDRSTGSSENTIFNSPGNNGATYAGASAIVMGVVVIAVAVVILIALVVVIRKKTTQTQGQETPKP